MGADKIETNQIASSLYDAYREYLSNQVKILSQEPDLMNTGDLFSGYTITYEIGNNRYALVTLVEYDKENRYQYRIEKKADSLIELND